ncbi:MAG: MmgE/PrpD family protein [Hyphomonadaceae bacterium]
MLLSSTSSLTRMACWTSDTPADWSETAIHTAHMSLIDTVACIMAGATSNLAGKLWSGIGTWGNGPCSLAGRAETLSAPWAALYNGTCAHALDFDDNFDPAKAHASAVLIPAILAIAEQEDADMASLIDAYIVGLQIMGRVGQAVNPFHRNRGWHATATLGAIGAAAACARLMRLPADKTAHAISMSTSRAGGFMSQFGSETKPLHAGFAASGGVQSALLARAGLSAGTQTLEGNKGLRTLMVGPDIDALAEQMRGTAEHGQTMTFDDTDIGTPLHIETYGLKIKRYPNCGSVHRALDGVLALREEHGLTLDNTEEIFVRAPESHLNNLMYEQPTNEAEAKFSLEYNLAAGLKSGMVALSDFTDEAIARADVRAFFPKIRKEYVPKMESEFPTEVHIRTNEGTTHCIRITMPIGSKASPISMPQLFDKFDACMDAAFGSGSGSGLIAILTTLSESRQATVLGAQIRAADNQTHSHSES